jgi:hypothetical protein
MCLSERRFLRLAAWLPIVLPLPIAVVAVSTPIPRYTGEPAYPLLTGYAVMTALVLMYSLFIGGLPYLLYAGVALWRLRHQSAAAHRRFARYAPLQFAALLGGLALAYTVFVADVRWSAIDSLANAAGFAAFALVFGYAYVLIVELLRRVLLRVGCIEGSDA